MRTPPESDGHRDWDRLWRLVHTRTGECASRPLGLEQVLERICRVAVEDLVLSGAAVTLPPRPDSHVVAAASDDAARRLEQTQFDTGEGPTLDACRRRLPVLVPDLTAGHESRWPGFGQAASAAGVVAAYALPLRVGATLLGALTLYGAAVGPLPRPRMRTALVLAEIGVETLVDGSVVGEAGHDDALAPFRQAIDGQAHIYQAQGMVMVQLGVTLTEALARMRAHAYAHGLTLDALATAIVSKDIDLDQDGPGA
ncbi:ANTAR domain-containing protein [Nocardioides sp. HDW12B]|uniref:GAF and ANTAR domain-containing protein n=1 Tax=Nocardioides sp. HDW12B TaxID=2714939 RepID=UPI00140C01E0|nr:GAF and ANTAR domain-containing protein [Nocardioides sp. HDW12B]QIK64934.1 ANTAR domain-containing protein [Nocardioides sp. HDW12B]